MVAYNFYLNNSYLNDGRNEASLIGILPERRKNRRRVTRKSIMKWGRLVAGNYLDPNSVYYVQVELRDEQ